MLMCARLSTPLPMPGQDESILLGKTTPDAVLTAAQELLAHDPNIVFDVHAYNLWLGHDEATIFQR